MEKISYSGVGGLVLAIILITSLLVGTYHSSKAGRDIVALCKNSSEPESLRHRSEGFSKRDVILSHLQYYQRKFINARINLRKSYIIDASQSRYAQRVKQLAVTLSYWEYRYIKLKLKNQKQQQQHIYRV